MKKTRTKKQRAPEELIEAVAAELQNIFWNGFEGRRGVAFRIQRTFLRNLFDIDRLRTSTIETLSARLKLHGFFLYPFNPSDPASAREWVFEKWDRVAQMPLVDELALKRADQRIKSVT